MSLRVAAHPQYKSSGAKWVGRVPEYWGLRRLRSVARKPIKNGVGESAQPYRAEWPRYVRITDIGDPRRLRSSSLASLPPDAAEGALVEQGDLLLAAVGATYGKSYLQVDNSYACFAGYLVRVSPVAEVLPEFLSYWTESDQYWNQVQSGVIKATIENFSAARYKNLRLAIPPLSEQKAIVAFLDYLDRQVRRLLEAQRRLIELLNEQKQVMVQQAVTRGLDQEVRLKRSGVEWLGDVPEHWDLVRLGRLVEIATGYPFPSDGFTLAGDGMRLLRGINIAPGEIRWDAVVRWSAADVPRFGPFMLREGDIVLGMDRPVIRAGVRVAILVDRDVPSLLLQRVARIRTRSSLDPSFLYLLLSGRGFGDYLAPIYTGISVPHVSTDQVAAFAVPLPPIEEQLAIATRVRAASVPLNSAITRARHQSNLLREYRTRLISDVVTGKLDVRSVELPALADEDEDVRALTDVEEEAEEFGAGEDEGGGDADD